MIHEARNWLKQSGSYTMGLDIMRALHKDNHLSEFQLLLCISGETEITRAKMKECINSFIQKVDEGQIIDIRKTMMPKRTKAPRSIDAQRPSSTIEVELPDDLKELDQYIKDLYARNRIIKGQLRALLYDHAGALKSKKSTYRSREERLHLASLAAANQKGIDAMWKRIDFFKITGERLPGTEPVMERRQLAIWLRDLPQYVNYIRQANSKFTRTGEYTDKDRYDQYIGEMDKIKKYIDEWL